jgi:hypothetical protein
MHTRAMVTAVMTGHVFLEQKKRAASEGVDTHTHTGKHKHTRHQQTPTQKTNTAPTQNTNTNTNTQSQTQTCLQDNVDVAARAGGTRGEARLVPVHRRRDLRRLAGAGAKLVAPLQVRACARLLCAAGCEAVSETFAVGSATAHLWKIDDGGGEKYATRRVSIKPRLDAPRRRQQRRQRRQQQTTTTTTTTTATTTTTQPTTISNTTKTTGRSGWRLQPRRKLITAARTQLHTQRASSAVGVPAQPNLHDSIRALRCVAVVHVQCLVIVAQNEETPVARRIPPAQHTAAYTYGTPATSQWLQGCDTQREVDRETGVEERRRDTEIQGDTETGIHRDRERHTERKKREKDGESGSGKLLPRVRAHTPNYQRQLAARPAKLPVVPVYYSRLTADARRGPPVAHRQAHIVLAVA